MSDGANRANGARATTALGVWATLGETRTTVELLGAGFGWVGLDAQHGHFDDAAVRDVLARRWHDAPAVLVRVGALDARLIGRALDAGADGVIVPMVSDAGQAAQCVAATHHPPRGTRSWGPLPGAGGYDLPSARGESRPGPVCAVMVETAAAVEQVEEIAATPGLDMLFVGPMDLSLALGVEVDALLGDRRAGAPLRAVVTACERAGLTPGAYAGTPERARALLRLGFTWVAVTTDAAVLGQGAERALTAAQLTRRRSRG